MARALQLASLQAISNSALSGKDLPTRLKVLNWGKNETLKGPVIVDDETFAIFASNQKKIGRERAPIDFDHNTVKGTDAYKELKGNPPTIFGYGTPRVIHGDGIWFEDITWTPDGEKQARNFHDLSPTPLLDNQRVLAIHSCALTPAGAVEGLTFYSAFSSIETLAAEINPNEREGDEYDCMRAMDSDDHYAKYGDVEYADSENHKYPVDTEKHVRAAWSYINMPRNSGKYSPDKLSSIKRKIKAAAGKHGVQIQAHSAEFMQILSTASDPSTPDAYRGARELVDKEGLSKTGSMNKEHFDYFRSRCHLSKEVSEEEIAKHVMSVAIKHLKADGDADGTVMGHLAAMCKFHEAGYGHSPNPDPNNPAHMNQFPSEGGPVYKQMVADAIKPLTDTITTLTADITALKAKQDTAVADAEQSQKNDLVAQATRDGKVIPLSADTIKGMSLSVLKELVAGLPKASVPVKKLAPLNADGKPPKRTLADASAAIQAQLSAAGMV